MTEKKIRWKTVTTAKKETKKKISTHIMNRKNKNN